VGNHDESPNGDPEGTEEFNQWFPSARYADRPWYGGHYGTNNDNHYILFSASGLDFIAIHMAYDTTPSSAVLDWARDLLASHPNRRGIVVAHSIAGVGNPAGWTAQGSATYKALKGSPNLFMMLCGHISGEGRRTDTSAGTIHTLMADYQSRTNGGDGWLRILEFVPADNAINVKTYSPTLDRYENDLDSQFSLTYQMGGIPFAELGHVEGAVSGADVSFAWADLQLGMTCEWYATASDGHSLARGPVRRFIVGDAFIDLDGDGDVDQDDFAIFGACATGANIPYDALALPQGCTLSASVDGKILADQDRDGDVDQDDFGVLQRCYSGPGQAAAANCGN
jgi:hypothetical protein